MADRHSRLNRIYRKMRQRCELPSEKSYKLYGGRGVTVCEEWKTYSNFKQDMFDSYKEGLTLDRIDNNRGYSKENCRWSTMEEQQNNRRNNTLFTFNNQTMTLSRWSRKLNINRSTLSMRIYKYGWTLEEALTKPVEERNII